MDNSKEVIQVPIELIVPNRFQPRIAFDEKALQELSDSIKQHGIIQPLVVRKLNEKYEIIAGERRYKAASMAGLTNVPVVINNMSDSESAEVALIENVQRKDLTPIEEAISYQNIIEKNGLTQEQLAKKLGLSQSAISNKLRLLALSANVQDALLKEKISERHARSLLTLSSPKKQDEWLARIINERLSVRQLDDLLKGRVDSSEDVPLVNINTSVEDIKTNATDIISNINYSNQDEEESETNEKMIRELENEPVRMSAPSTFSFHNIFDDIDKSKDLIKNDQENEASEDELSENLFANIETTSPTSHIDSLDIEENLESIESSEENVDILDFDISDSLNSEPVDNNIEEFEEKDSEEFPEYLTKINAIRNFIKTIDDSNVNIEELDLDGTYKINITINKED